MTAGPEQVARTPDFHPFDRTTDPMPSLNPETFIDSTEEVLPDVWRITVPLPFRPSRVHAYLARSAGGGWMLVDGGLDTPEAWSVLSTAVERIAGWDQLSVHVVTHMHLDHIGLARRIRDASSVPLALGILDAERTAHAFRNPEEEERFRDHLFFSHGVDPEVSSAVQRATGESRSLAPYVEPDHLLPTSGAPVPGASDWTCVWTPGHTAGHVSLFREAGRVLIAGDAVLPRISPTIGVNRQRQDPVGDYLQALGRIAALEPEAILAGHGETLTGSGRVVELREEAMAETGRVRALLGAEPVTAWSLAERRYEGRTLPPGVRIQALRETIAHLDHLALRREAERQLGADGIVRYSAP
jgi:glyoxylase-like metal-dependent hydrolase (beta-lactamase superfamily II)